MKNNFIAISIFCLAISIVIGGKSIAQGLIEIAGSENNINLTTSTYDEQSQTQQPQLLSYHELANYLGISVEEASKLGPNYSTIKRESVIPYIEIQAQVYFSRAAVDNWLQSGESLSIQN